MSNFERLLSNLYRPSQENILSNISSLFFKTINIRNLWNTIILDEAAAVENVERSKNERFSFWLIDMFICEIANGTKWRLDTTKYWAQRKLFSAPCVVVTGKGKLLQLYLIFPLTRIEDVFWSSSPLLLLKRKSVLMYSHYI